MAASSRPSRSQSLAGRKAGPSPPHSYFGTGTRLDAASRTLHWLRVHSCKGCSKAWTTFVHSKLA